MELAKIHLLLSEQRRVQGLSQKEIADKLNVEQATISLYENGKRGIPLELLDPWLMLLGIEIKLNTRGSVPVRAPEETMNDLDVFKTLKRRRNYLIPEMRTMLAEKIMQDPLFQQADAETGESQFWTYSFGGDPAVGVVETRYDHPEQKFLAVEYTEREVNLYKFLSAGEVGEDQSDPEWLKISRIYFSEDDFLTFGGQWDEESMEARKVTILRENKNAEEGVEIVSVEGFSLRTLTEIQNTFLRLKTVVNQVTEDERYSSMNKELDEISYQIVELALDNCYENGAMNPDFELWSETDKAVIDVPLWAEKRSWYWICEGEEWNEEYPETTEVQVYKEDAVYEELNPYKQGVFYTHKHEDGSRVIGLIGEEHKPAVFQENVHKPGVIYRVETEAETLSDKEYEGYRKVLKATEELDKLREEAKRR